MVLAIPSYAFPQGRRRRRCGDRGHPFCANTPRPPCSLHLPRAIRRRRKRALARLGHQVGQPAPLFSLAKEELREGFVVGGMIEDFSFFAAANTFLPISANILKRQVNDAPFARRL